MSIQRANEMVKHLSQHSDAAIGFKADTMFEVANKFGLTRKETLTLFMGRHKMVGRRYPLPTEVSDDIIASGIPTAVGTVAVKSAAPKGGAKKAKAVKGRKSQTVAKKAAPSGGAAVESTDAIYEWYADFEEGDFTDGDGTFDDLKYDLSSDDRAEHDDWRSSSNEWMDTPTMDEL